MKAFDSEWARYIRGRAAEQGLNQADLGRSLGRSKQTGHRLWHGELRPDEELCVELAEILQVPLDDLRVACGYLPEGTDPRIERDDEEIVVRLRVPIIYAMTRHDWFRRPIDFAVAA